MVNFVHLAGWLDHEKHGFPGNSRVNDPPASAGDTGSIPGPGRSHVPVNDQARGPQEKPLQGEAGSPQVDRGHAHH